MHLRALVVVLLMPALTFGCGSAQDDDAGDATGAATSGVRSVRFERVTTTSSGEESRDVGVMDFARNRTDVILGASGPGGGGPRRWITIGDNWFIELLQVSPSGKRWGRIDLAQLRAERRRYLQETGVDCTRYRFEVDQRVITRSRLEREGWPSGLIERAVESTSLRAASVDVWVDADGAARRVVTTVPLVNGSMETSTEHFDFGVDVEIEAPLEDEVADAPESGWTSYGPFGGDTEEAGSDR